MNKIRRFLTFVLCAAIWVWMPIPAVAQAIESLDEDSQAGAPSAADVEQNSRDIVDPEDVAGDEPESRNSRPGEQEPHLDVGTSDPEASDPEDADIEAQLEALHTEVEEASEEQDESLTEVAVPAPAQSAMAQVAAGVQSMNPDMSFILDLAGAWFSDTPSLGGGHDPGKMGFNMQQLELALGADIDPYFRLDANIVFHSFEVEIEEVYATTLALPAHLQLRAGQFLSRFGRHNPTHLHAWNFVTNPLVNSKFLGGEGMRGLGVELSQMVAWMPGTFQWYASFQNISGASTGRSFAPSSADITGWTDLTATLRGEEFVELSRDWDLLLGVSYANGRNHSGRDNRSEVYGADTFLKWRPRSQGGRSSVGWQTEFMLRRRQVPGSVLQDFGLFSWLEWQMSRRWSTAIRGEYVSAVDGGPDEFADVLDPEWTRDRQRGTLQLTFLPSHFSRLRLEYALDHLPYRADELGDAHSNPAELIHMVLLQAEFVIGAHGAHAY